MDNKQLQTWLYQLGFYQGNIDGIVGRQTREALRKAQQYLADRGLYKKAIDGIVGSGTRAAIDTYNKGKRYFNKLGVSYNIYNKDSMDAVVKALRSKGVGSVKINGRLVNLGSNTALDDFYTTAADMIANRRSVNVPDSREGNASRKANNAKTAVKAYKSTQAASNGGGSSFKAGSLDDLVMRYAYDKYHGTDVNDADWGISYDYTPQGGMWNKTKTLGGTRAIELVIDSGKYTPEQAAQIARGAGMLSYTYGGKGYQTNLFTGSSYKDFNDFNTRIAELQSTSGTQAAQNAYNAEMKRQYDTYGIDHNMLKNKNTNQWNSLFGIIPYGYNPESVGAIAKGQQSVQYTEGTASDWRANNLTYRRTADNPNGRFVYNNFDEWKQGRMLANPRYTANGGISPVRAVTSTYSMGFPVAKSLRGQLTFLGARPNGDQIDRTNYYTLTDKDRGSSKMQAWVYNEVRKNPTAAYKYFQHIYGNRKKTFRGNLEAAGDRDYKFDVSQATRLASAAGLTPYHLNTTGGDFIDKNPLPVIGANDLWGALKTFYENAYDENGNLNKNFSYTENGYNNRFDGGAYTVSIRGGKPINAEDIWNVELANMGLNMNAGRTSKKGHQGLPLLARFKMGGLVKFITSHN